MAQTPTWPMLANRTQGLRAVGGSLHLDERSLRFEPSVFEKPLGGKPAVMPLDEIVEIGVQPGRVHPSELFSGGLRKRLAVTLSDGRRELFVVNKLDTAVDLLRTALADRTPE